MELFVEGTRNVPGVDVCVVLESFGAAGSPRRPPVGQSVYSVPVGACASPVVPWLFYVFPPEFCPACAYEGGDLFV